MAAEREHFPLIKNTFLFEVFKVYFFLFTWDSSDGISSFLAIRSHCESLLTGAVSLQWGSSRHLLLPRLLTVGRSIVQEVGRHFPFTFDLNHPATLQHVPFVCKHLVQVCSHLSAERKKICMKLDQYLANETVTLLCSVIFRDVSIIFSPPQYNVIQYTIFNYGLSNKHRI